MLTFDPLQSCSVDVITLDWSHSNCRLHVRIFTKTTTKKTTHLKVFHYQTLRLGQQDMTQLLSASVMLQPGTK